MNAAVTARCLFDQNPPYFFKFVDYIYRHQGAENENWTTVSNMLSDASKNTRCGYCPFGGMRIHINPYQLDQRQPQIR